MSKTNERAGLPRQVGPAIEKFMGRVGLVHLGPDPLDETTAANLNKIIEDIESGKDPGGLPPEWIAEDERLKRLWEEKFLKKK